MSTASALGWRKVATFMYTVPNAAHISEKCLGVYMGASPLAGKILKPVLPNPFGNFRNHLTLLPSEISEKSCEETKTISTGFNPMSS
jgi:hypothetical protein